MLLDDDLISDAGAGVDFLSPGFAYAACVFEGLCVYAGPSGPVIFRLDAHLRRLEASMRAMGFEGAPSRATLRARVLRAVAEAGLDGDGHVRLMAFVDGETRISARGPVRTAIFTKAAGARPSDRPGFHCHVSSWRKPPDTAMPARIKCTSNYAIGRMATLEAERAGADAAILLAHDGAVAEGATANLFVVRNGVLSTPRLCDGILEGITRDTLIRLWNGRGGAAVQERRIDRSELSDCEAAFFCGSLWEISPVLSVDGVAMDPGHPAIAWLKARYAAVVRGAEGEPDWCVPVRPEV